MKFFMKLLIIILIEHFDFCFTCFLKMLLILRKSLSRSQSIKSGLFSYIIFVFNLIEQLWISSTVVTIVICLFFCSQKVYCDVFAWHYISVIVVLGICQLLQVCQIVLGHFNILKKIKIVIIYYSVFSFLIFSFSSLLLQISC